MPVSTRIYASVALAFGGQPAIDDLTAAAYETVLIWSVHVDTDGTLYLNDTRFVSDGVYGEAQQMNLPATVTQLRDAGMEILFSVGAGETSDFTNIGTLLAGGVPGPGSPLYDNFAALKQAMVDAGGDIDGIDLDNEDNQDASVMVNFGRMLAAIGYDHVTLCPASPFPGEFWTSTLAGLNTDPGVGFVNAIHLQCYSGGSGSAVPAVIQGWQQMIADAGSAGTCLLIPGLATNQAAPGPWWYEDAPGGSVVKTPGTAMDPQADWSKHLFTQNYPNASAALQGVQSRRGPTFFFYCNEQVDLGPGRQFAQGDAVFFAGEPSWSATPQCDAFSLSGGCSDIYNGFGACPANLQEKYQTLSNIKTPPQGGFIWYYDSVVDCFLSGCCKDPAATARAYREAIERGLAPGGHREERHR